MRKSKRPAKLHLAILAEAAFKEAVAEVIADHKRTGFRLLFGETAKLFIFCRMKSKPGSLKQNM